MATLNLNTQISNFNTKHYVIVVAGGSGTRMLSSVPKQFLLLNGLPVLMHTLNAFAQSKYQPEIILVLPANFHDYWDALCITHNFTISHSLITGGETRFHSVKNGLDLVTDKTNSIVAIQDAVRPLTSTAIINHAYEHAAEFGNAVVAVKSRDSIRQVKNNLSASLIRDEIYLVQTPQTFKISQLTNAYNQPYSSKFTDDASVVEETGIAINIIEGSYTNVKITFPEDIAIAELLLKAQSPGEAV